MDRFVRGCIIGMVTSAIKDTLSWVDYIYLGFTNATYAHLMGGIIFGRRINTPAEIILAQIVELGFEGFIGILFIYFAYRTYNKGNLWFKGILFADSVYLFTFAIGSFFKLPVLHLASVGTSASTLLTSTIFGALMGVGVNWWGKKVGDLEDEEIEGTESIKFKFAPQPARKTEKQVKKIQVKKPKKN